MTNEFFQLEALAAIRVTGEDATDFLQGQLTQNVSGSSGSALAGWCSAKGRLRALAQWIYTADCHWLVVPGDTADALMSGLNLYRLRSRVSLELGSDLGLRVGGAIATADADVVRPDEFALVEARAGAAGLYVCIAPDSAIAINSDAQNTWNLAETAAGIPAIFAATAELFVPQMVNLDLLDGISFEKGCYVGQEIVARTQNLGRIKRRMMRYSASQAWPPGTSVYADRRKTGTVVRSAMAAPGSNEGSQAAEVLAVVRLDDANCQLHADPEGQHLLEPRPLPYTVPGCN
jgi:folate-binding protein YgfZ